VDTDDGETMMAGDHVEGLRKAARRVFWEAGNIETQIEQACRDTELDLARSMDLWAERNRQDERINSIAASKGQNEEWAKAYCEGAADALAAAALILRTSDDKDWNEKIRAFLIGHRMPLRL
jgi:hypothetical protein